jgi:hypothetical protein
VTCTCAILPIVDLADTGELVIWRAVRYPAWDCPTHRALEPDDPRHGFTAGYGRGCRCPPCCSAQAQYWERRQRRAARSAP